MLPHGVCGPSIDPELIGIVNQSLSAADTSSPMLAARAKAERDWVKKVPQISNGNFAVIPWLQNLSIQNIGNFKDKG